MFGLEAIFGPIEPLVRVVSTTIISYPLKDWILKTISFRAAKGTLKPLKKFSFRRKLLLQLDLYRWSKNHKTRALNRSKRKQRNFDKKLHKQRVKRISKIK